MTENTAELARVRVKKIMGVVLMLSPWGNFFYSAYLARPAAWWHPAVLGEYVGNIATVSWMLWGASFSSGFMLVAGSASSMVFAIGLMGINVFYSAMTFAKNIVQYGWLQTTVLAVMNISFFIFMVWYEYKNNSQEKLIESWAQQRFNITLKRKVHIRFNAAGEWGKIIEVRHNGIIVEPLQTLLPENIDSAEFELQLTADLLLRLRAKAFSIEHCEFEFIGIQPKQVYLLQNWAKRLPKPSHPERKAS